MSVIKLAKKLTLEGHPDAAMELLAFWGDKRDLPSEDFIPSLIYFYHSSKLTSALIQV